MAFPSAISDVVATTIELRSKTIADNVTAHNAALAFMQKSGNVQTASGGSVIRELFSFAENGNGGSYSGYDLLPTGAQDVISGADYPWAQYAVPVTFNGLEMLKNSGPAAMLDLVKARVKVAESTMENLLNRHLYLDGTGNNGKNLTGFAAAIPLANTAGIYGGIDRSVTANTFWRNQKWQATVDGGGVATAATIIAQFNAFILNLTRGSDRPNVIIASPQIYGLLQSAAQPLQQYINTNTANLGFEALNFQGIPVIFDTNASGISANVAYFLNTDYMHLRPHSDRNMIALDDKQSINQDATVKTLVWAGNVTSSGPKFQGVFSNT